MLSSMPCPSSLSESSPTFFIYEKFGGFGAHVVGVRQAGMLRNIGGQGRMTSAKGQDDWDKLQAGGIWPASVTRRATRTFLNEWGHV